MLISLLMLQMFDKKYSMLMKKYRYKWKNM